ncbi:hypothetical protein J7L33_02060 [Candidatus Bathyarchaeota archaeon]|nr:hypothetical protein [Candidatus Bathyarchaeota archaeon]RLI14675.1 MAG: hypothetical protein DRO41_05335 [Candidatus Bathyarchaeota archaeon]
MIDEKEKEDVEEVREILGVVSKEIPALIKGIIASVFSEEAGKDMGRAVAAFYKELKEAGMPEQTAVRMAENYMSTFTSLGDVLKKAVSGKGEFKGEEIGEEISRKIREELSKKHGEEEKEEE